MRLQEHKIILAHYDEADDCIATLTLVCDRAGWVTALLNGEELYQIPFEVLSKIVKEFKAFLAEVKDERDIKSGESGS